jgi:hypothetical protein
MVCSAQTVHQSCIKISTIYLASRLALSQNRPNRAPLGVSSGASKTIYEPMVLLTQTEHLSCTDANTVPKQIETRLWYVRRKPCNNLASSVALSPNVSNRDSTWASSPRSPIECVQNDFYAYGMLVQTVHLSYTDTNTVSKWTKMRF